MAKITTASATTNKRGLGKNYEICKAINNLKSNKKTTSYATRFRKSKSIAA